MRTLDQRIVAAFTDAAKASDLAVLIKELETAIISSEALARQERSRALDPTLSDAVVADARQKMEDASFQVERYREAARRLNYRHQEVKTSEEDSRRVTAYEAALKERDELAAQLSAIYPALSVQLADLASRIDSNDRVLERINSRGLPAGMKYLEGAEEVARGIRGYRDSAGNVPRITQELRLPAFKHEALNAYAWPKPNR